MQTLTKTLSGARIIIEVLKKFNIDTVFGYPGGIVLNVYNELFKQNYVKHYLVRHEQAAVHAAEGYARVSGKCGVALVTSGPGASNIVTGIANAYLDNYPLVIITGQVASELLYKDAFQEVDIIDITRSCTKKNFQVRRAEDLEKTLVEAFNTATHGRKGPVVVDITKNVFSENVEYANLDFDTKKSEIPFYDINLALDEISKAQRPIIIAGGGVIQSGASSELDKFVRILDIPVVSTMMGLGAAAVNYAGMIGIFGQQSANEAVKRSDLIFAIGTRFNDRITCCFQENELCKKLIHLDIDENEISKIIPASISIVGDAKDVLHEMNLKVNCLRDYSSWLQEAKSFISENSLPVKRTLNMHSFEVMQEINKCLKDKNFVITTEVGQHQVWAARYLEFNTPGKFIISGGLGTMGFGFPAAIGACVANNEPVICIAGDGSFQMNIQELATCMDYGLPIKVFILNNGYLGMVRQIQEKNCDETYFDAEISNPDFVKLAQSYGAKGCRVENISDIKPAIEAALAFDGPCLIDFAVEPKELL